MLISFVIPCYGSANTIESVVDEIRQTMNTRKNYEYEIVLVNDCSPDNVYEKITTLAENDKNVKVINLAKNFGQHNAIIAGLGQVTGEVTVCLDDDGQTPANEVFKLIDKLDEGYDIAFAKYNIKKHSLFRNLGSKVNSLMAEYLIGKPKSLYISSYFVCKKFVVDTLIKYKNPYPYISGLLLQTTKRIANVDINHRSRTIGDSGYTFVKLISLWLNGFTAFSIKPLRIATVLGFLCAIAGFVYGLVTVINYFILPNVPLGYSSMMAALLFVGGMLMLMLGLIGEYIGRIYLSINNMPQYVIKETINL